jgi:rare lipoprotein A
VKVCALIPIAGLALSLVLAACADDRSYEDTSAGYPALAGLSNPAAARPPTLRSSSSLRRTPAPAAARPAGGAPAATTVVTAERSGLPASTAGVPGSPSGSWRNGDGAPPPEIIPANVRETPDAIPREEPRSPYGNPNSYEVFGETFEVLPSAHGYHARGVASWYGTQFHGLRTASGELYDMFAMTAAHKTLPIPTYLKVTNLNNHLSVVVRVNDRGPFLGQRLLDLSYAAAAKLDMLGTGSAPVDIEAVEPMRPAPTETASGLYLQAGSFADPVDAVLRRQAIADLGIQHVELSSVPNGRHYVHRVYVGPFVSDVALKRTRLLLDNANIDNVSVQR